MQAAFSVSPTSQTLNLAPGEVVTGTILVANYADATEDFHYKISVVPYNVSGQDYQVDTSQVSTYSQMANWITIDQPTGTLAPNETVEVEFTIRVPESAPGGAQTAALIVSSDPNQAADSHLSVDSVFQIASTLYANVTGETTSGGAILENNVPVFAFSTPVSATALFSNTGNVYETAVVQLSVTDNFSHQSLLSGDSLGGSSYAEIILPETTRYISRNIENLPVIGSVHVEQTISYQGQTSVTSHDLFILPIWFILLVLAIIAAAIAGIIAAVRHHRRRKALL